MKNPMSQTEKVVHAVRHEDFETFVTHLEAMEDVSRQFLSELLAMVPVPWFVEAQHQDAVKMVQYLLERGADVNFRDQYGNTLLLTILSHNQMASRQEWKNNPYCFYGDPNFNHELCVKAYEACVEIIKIILQYQPDLSILHNPDTDHAESAFSLALRFENYAVAKMLLEHGGDIVNDDSVDDAVCMYLSRKEASDFLKIYQARHPEFKTVKPESRIHPAYDDIYHAMADMDYPLFIQLLNKSRPGSIRLYECLLVNISIPFVDTDFSTTIKMVEHLLGIGVDANATCLNKTLAYNIVNHSVVRSRYFWKNNPLMTGTKNHYHIAKKIYAACMRILDILIDYDADLSRLYDYGTHTLISVLLQSKNFEVAEYLLKKGADPTVGSEIVKEKLQEISDPQALELLKPYGI